MLNREQSERNVEIRSPSIEHVEKFRARDTLEHFDLFP